MCLVGLLVGWLGLIGPVLWLLLLITPLKMVCPSPYLWKHPLSSLQLNWRWIASATTGFFFCLFNSHIAKNKKFPLQHFVWGQVWEGRPLLSKGWAKIQMFTVTHRLAPTHLPGSTRLYLSMCLATHWTMATRCVPSVHLALKTQIWTQSTDLLMLQWVTLGKLLCNFSGPWFSYL